MTTRTMTVPIVEQQTSRDTAGALALDWFTCRAVLPQDLRDPAHFRAGPRCLEVIAVEGAGVTTPVLCPYCGSRVV